MFTRRFLAADLDYKAGDRAKARGWKDKDIEQKFDWELAGLLVEMMLYVNDGDRGWITRGKWDGGAWWRSRNGRRWI